jgi:hypothetical protein
MASRILWKGGNVFCCTSAVLTIQIQILNRRKYELLWKLLDENKNVIILKIFSKEGFSKTNCPVYQSPLYTGIGSSSYGRFTLGTYWI